MADDYMASFTDREILALCKRATDGCEFMPGRKKADGVGVISFSFKGRQARVIGRYLDECIKADAIEERKFRRWLRHRLATDPEFRKAFESSGTHTRLRVSASTSGLESTSWSKCVQSTDAHSKK